MGQSARWFVDVGGEILGGISFRTDAALDKYLEKKGGLERPEIGFVQVAYSFAPKPITVKDFAQRAAYNNPEPVGQEMEAAAERGWLKAVGDGQYKLTDKGQEVAKGLFVFADEQFGSVEAPPEVDLERTATLLGKVVKKAHKLPEPADKPAFSWTPMFTRKPSAAPMVRLRRFILDLFAYRDDVHVAAWRAYDIEGPAWEAFTYVKNGEAGTAAELAEQLPYRSYDEAVYAAALQDVATRGWIVEQDGKYVATEKGQALRDEAEEATDRYFDAPWAALSEAEMKEVKGLLKKLGKALKPPEEEAEEEAS